MAKLPAVIESLEKVDEPYRGAYVEKEGGGGFVLDADVEAHPSVAGLRTTKDKLSAGLKKAEAALARFKDVDPERYAQLVREAEEREAGGGGAPDAEKLRKKLEADVRKEYEPVVTERDTLRAQLEKHQLFDVADAAALKGGVLPERLEDARAAYTRYVRLTAEKKVEVLDESGDPTGKTVAEFFTGWFKEKKPWFFAGSGASGGGAQGSTASGVHGGVLRLTREEARDPQRYQAARAKAEKDGLRLEITPAVS
jgi:hypothetical protein